jgi:PHD/YefM family antitoxin component YafN of YafNO toxin-antitoxin module
VSTEIRTIPAREIKRRGIGAVDEALKEGPVHVIRNDRPAYVVLDEAQYAELLEAQREAYVAGIKQALAEAEAGRGREVTAQQLIAELGLEE